MRILLPPSEAKTAGGRGKPLSSRTTQDELALPRLQLLAGLHQLLPTPAAAAALLMPPSVAQQSIAANAAVLNAPTMPALLRYSGSVYEGLDAAALTPAARRLANRNVLIFSGLFGVLRGSDPVPLYRVPAKASIPGIGIAGTFWRPHLDERVPALLDNELIIDLRSSDYAAMWQPARDGSAIDRHVSVRILSPRPDGSLGVISFPSKFGKGLFAAALLERRAIAPIRSADELGEIWIAAGGKDAAPRPSKRGVAVDLITFTAKPKTSL